MNASTALQSRITDQQIAQAKAVSIIDLAGEVTTLHRESSGSLAGPCPRCGGDDRLVIKIEENRFFCRHCLKKGGDTINLMQWLHGDTFPQAIARLTNGSIAASIPRAAPKPAPDTKLADAQLNRWLAELRSEVAEAQERLLSPSGEAGQEYLTSRGIEPRTWLTYGLGYSPGTPVPGTGGKMKAPAILLPWQNKQGELVAARYRFTKTQRRTDADGKAKEYRLTSRPKAHADHAPFSGQMFGWQGLPEWALEPVEEGERTAHRLCALVFVEAEINAMSCQQVAGDTHLHSLSIGSEGGRPTPEDVKFARRYGQVFCFTDRKTVAEELAKLIPGAVWITSPGGNDANSLLQQGTLGGFLAATRKKYAKNDEELEGLLWNLWDAAALPAGVDSGTAAVIRHIAAKLGRKAAIYEAEPNRWITSWPTSR